MNALANGRSWTESGVVRRASGGAFALALREVASSSRASAAIAFALEDDQLVPHAVGGSGASMRISADDRRTLARPLASRCIERARGLDFLSPRFADALLIPLFDRGDPVGLVCLAYDGGAPATIGCDAAIELAGMALASELRRTRRATDDADLRELSRLASLGLLLVGVTHELRGPAGALALLVPEIVAVLEGNATKTPEETRSLGRDLRCSTERILEVCGRLRGAGRRDHQRTPIDLREVARDAVELARLNAPEIAFTIFEGSGAVEVVGVRAELDQVAMNLLLNAIDACRAAPANEHRVDVAVIAEANATLTVSDTGHGIDAGIADRIFERFFTTKPKGAGTGVGLWASRDIAESHGGALTFVPSAEGATFTMRLPVRTRERARPTLVDDRRDPAARLRVLLVDDDPIVLRTHRRGLSAFDVRTAGSVAEARRELAASDIDIVVSDLAMADGGGVALHRWMVDELGAARPPLLFLTGGVTDDRQRAAVEATACRCLIKPMPMDALATAIRHAVRSSRA